MAHIYIAPNWFLGYDILFELAFAVITLVVSIYAFKVYKLSEQKQSKLFGISFLLIFISNLIQAFLNFAIISKINENISLLAKLSSVVMLIRIETYLYATFFMAGLITLVYTTLKIKSFKAYSLLFIITISSFFLASNIVFMFHFLASVLLIYIFIHFLMNYLNQKEFKTLIVMIAFAFLLFGDIHYLVTSINHALYYIIGNFLELIAYLLILLNLILVVKKAK